MKEIEIPDIARGGILIDQANPQPEIRRASEKLNWLYKEEATFMYQVGSLMMDRFFNGLVYLDGRKVPDPLIAFDNLRNKNTLAKYDLKPDEYGLMYKITHNTEQYDLVEGKPIYHWGSWAQCETQLHEMLHVWQQHGRGKDPYSKGRNTHNKEFVDKAKSLGLNVFPVIGCHIAVADPSSPFAILMNELEISRPDDVPTAIEWKKDGGYRMDWFKFGSETKGKSTLSKWECGCGQKVRVGKKDWPGAVCNNCGTEYVKIDAVNQTIYKAPK